jgi:hypothetical protein
MLKEEHRLRVNQNRVLMKRGRAGVGDSGKMRSFLRKYYSVNDMKWLVIGRACGTCVGEVKPEGRGHLENLGLNETIIQCVRKVAVHLQKVLEVMSNSVHTGLNPFNFIRKHFLQICLLDVSCVRSYFSF